MKIMKYALYLITSILLIGLLSFHSVEKQLLPSKLRVTVIDELGNPVEEAEVTLYENEADYRASENAFLKGSTDKKGRVTFKEVEPKSYYLDARKGDKNNNGAGVVIGELEEGKLNKVNTVIE